MSSMFGSCLKLSLFGQSHGAGIGIVLDGFPAGMLIDVDRLMAEMNRRRPGQNQMTTQRQEADAPEFISGVLNGRTTGQPICAVIRNTGMHSADYGDGVDVLRPAHADYTGHVRYFGWEDWRGGGSFSGRLTAPIVLAGALCSQYLEEQGVRIESHICRIGKVRDTLFEELPEDADTSQLKQMDLPTLSKEAGEAMRREILEAAEAQDSIGGEVECRILGLPAGLGSPFFDSVESVLSHLFFSIPAVKGVEFGSGFALSVMRGSEANDAFSVENGKVVTQTNHAGGINGGITNGMPVICRLAVRPTPSIARTQASVSLKRMQNEELAIHGRHDPCILPRVTPVVESMAAIGVLDLWKERKTCLSAQPGQDEV